MRRSLSREVGQGAKMSGIAVKGDCWKKDLVVIASCFKD